MLKKLIGLIVLAMVLASCGEVLPGGNTVGSVTPVAETNQIKVSWTFTGDKATIDGFRIVRSVDGGSYAFLIDKLDPNATSHTDTNVEQGKTYKYGVAIIDSEGNPGSVVNQTGAGVSPKPPTGGGGSLTGNWKMIRTNDDPKNTPAVLTMSLDVTDTSGTLSGNAYLFSEGDPFGRGDLLGTIEGTNGSSGFTLRVVYSGSGGGFLELTGTVSGSTFSGDAIDANDVTGTFTGEKLTE